MTKRIRSRSLKLSVLGLSLISILFSLLLVCSPAVDAFGGAEAICSGGTKVYCSGVKCSATDNVGCQCTKEDGTKDVQNCPKGGKEFGMLEDVDSW